MPTNLQNNDSDINTKLMIRNKSVKSYINNENNNIFNLEEGKNISNIDKMKKLDLSRYTNLHSAKKEKQYFISKFTSFQSSEYNKTNGISSYKDNLDYVSFSYPIKEKMKTIHHLTHNHSYKKHYNNEINCPVCQSITIKEKVIRKKMGIQDVIENNKTKKYNTLTNKIMIHKNLYNKKLNIIQYYIKYLNI